VQTEAKPVECPTDRSGADAAPSSRDGGERDHRADSGEGRVVKKGGRRRQAMGTRRTKKMRRTG